MMDIMAKLAVSFEKGMDALHELAAQAKRANDLREKYAGLPGAEERAAEVPVTYSGAVPHVQEPVENAGERNALVAQLTALGVTIPDRTRTTTLVKMLAEAKAKAASPVATPAPAPTPAPAAPKGNPSCLACDGTGVASNGQPCVCTKTKEPKAKEPEAPAKVTHADVRARAIEVDALLHAKNPQDDTIANIIKTVGKSATLGGIGDGELAAVMAAINAAALKG